MPGRQPAPEGRRCGVLVDTLGYATERVGELVLTAIVGIVVARYLGPDGFGLLSYATGVFGLLAPVAALGMPSILVREFTTGDDRLAVLDAALGRQLPTAVLLSVAGFVLIVATRGTAPRELLLAASLAPLPLLGLSTSLRALLEARRDVRRIVVAGLASAVVAAIFRVAGVVLESPVWVFGLFVTVQSAITLVGLAGAIDQRSRFATVRRYDRERARRLVRDSWPLLLAGIAVTIYMRADVIMISLISGDAETGVYAAAARLSEVWYFLPMAGLAAARPRLTSLHDAGDLEGYRASTQRFMTASVAASLVIVVVVLLVGDGLVRLLYGSAYAGAGPVLRLHILAAPFVFLGVASGQWFIDNRMTQAVFIRSGVSAVLNVAINLALIPTMGALGAAIATLVAYASGVLINAFPGNTRELFRMQLRAFRLAWPR